jgi:methionine-rich copper-binding protein CopC
MNHLKLTLPVLASLAFILIACNSGSNQSVTPASTSPTIVSSAPANGSSNVAVNSNVNLIFSEKMNASSVTVSIDPNANLGSATWNAAGSELSLNPPNDLDPDTAYTLTHCAWQE